MPINQPLTQDIEIKKFKKKFLKKYGVHLYIHAAGHPDYKIALDVGSNMIRIGSLLFGKRNY